MLPPDIKRKPSAIKASPMNMYLKFSRPKINVEGLDAVEVADRDRDRVGLSFSFVLLPVVTTTFFLVLFLLLTYLDSSALIKFLQI